MRSINRRTLYIILCIMVIAVGTLSIAYAALSVTLNIVGNTEILASSWNVHLENAVVKTGSVNNTLPTISDGLTATFDATLTKPGDYYQFSIDVKNDGTIDAMIESVTKTSLTTEQAKYLSYIVEYENGDSITNKQLVKATKYVRLKVRVEYRKDLTAADLPSNNSNLTLSFTINYKQSDESNEVSEIPSSGRIITVRSGTGTQVGDKISIGKENFYVIGTEGDNIKLFAEYNLQVGVHKNAGTISIYPIENATGLQDSTCRGLMSKSSIDSEISCVLQFSSTAYWKNQVSSYPSYVFNNYGGSSDADQAIIINHINNYQNYLLNLTPNINEVRLISFEELVSLGCDSENKTCASAPEWVSNTSFWTGNAKTESCIHTLVGYNKYFYCYSYDSNMPAGIRPVVVIPASSIN